MQIQLLFIGEKSVRSVILKNYTIFTFFSPLFLFTLFAKSVI